MHRRWPGSAALVPIEAAATLRRIFRGGDMNPAHFLRATVCGALLTAGIVSSATAEGTFDIPAGAPFNQAKLEKVTEFFKKEVGTGKIAGANVLIRQRGKEVYHETFGVQDVVSRRPTPARTSSAWLPLP